MLAGVALCTSALLSNNVAARDDGRYANEPLHAWFDQLASGKGLCCSFADGFKVENVDWDTEDGRYRVRLHGTALASYAGDKTGQFLDDMIPPDLIGSYTSVYDTVLEMLEPMRVVRDFQVPELDYLAGESLVAPLSATGKTTPLILSLTYVVPSSATAR